MVHNTHILFFLYKSKINDKGKSPIFCRLTFKGNRKQFSTGFYLKEHNWNSKTQRFKGSSEDAQHINFHIESIYQQLNTAFVELTKERKSFAVDDIYNRYAGLDKEYTTLLQVFEYHNYKMKELVGKDYAKRHSEKKLIISVHR